MLSQIPRLRLGPDFKHVLCQFSVSALGVGRAEFQNRLKVRKNRSRILDKRSNTDKVCPPDLE